MAGEEFILLIGFFLILMVMFLLKVGPFARFRWPTIAVIKEIRRGGELIRFTKAKRIITPDNEVFYQLKSPKIRTKAVRYESLFLTPKGKNVVFILSPNHDEFLPVEPFNINKKDPNPIDENVRMWQSMRARNALIRWQRKDNLTKFLPIIMVVGALIGLGIMIYIVFQGIQPIYGALNGISANFAQAAEAMKDAAIISRGGTLPQEIMPIG